MLTMEIYKWKMFERPITDGILLVIILVLIYSVRQRRLARLRGEDSAQVSYGVGKVIFDLLMLAVLLVFLFSSLNDSLNNRLLPQIIAAPAVVLALISLFNSWRGSARRESGGNVLVDKKSFIKTLIPLLWISALGIGIWLIGFLWAVPLFVLFYLKKGKESWLLSFVLAAASLLFMDVLFIHALKVQLFTGIL